MKDLMKKIWKPGLALMLLSAPVLFACDDDDDKDEAFNPQVAQLATTRYPGATVTKTEREPFGYEIEMRIDGTEADMYVDHNLQWLRTEFEDMPWTSLPTAVTTAFDASGYTFNPYEDDVDRIEYPYGDTTAEYYRIELDREPKDIILLYNPDGTPYQTGGNTSGGGDTTGGNTPGGNTPGGGTQGTIDRQAITDAVTSRYPGATAVEVDREPYGYEAQFYLNGQEADMHFDTNYQWLYTEFEDMPYASLPTAVTAAFEATGYSFNPYEDDVDRIEYPDGDTTAEYYRIELDREPTDTVLLYNPDGTPRTR